MSINYKLCSKNGGSNQDLNIVAFLLFRFYLLQRNVIKIYVSLKKIHTSLCFVSN